jgi:cytochrome c peroxidase
MGRLPLLLVAIVGGSARADTGPVVPVALAWTSSGRLMVAARDGRELIVVNPDRWSIERTIPLAIAPASVVALGEKALAVGGTDGELAIVAESGQPLLNRLVGRGPARVAALRGGRVAVGCLWDEAIRIVDQGAGRIVGTHRLGFAPGALVVRPDGRLVVAGAFGGKLADLLPGLTGSERVRWLDGANLHAVAISGDGRELLVGQIAAFAALPVSRTNIDWGLVISSKLTAIRLSEFDDRSRPDGGLFFRRLALDGSGHGAADPSALAVSADGTKVAIALAGAHQVLVVDRTLGARTVADLLPLGDSQLLDVIDVGQSPVAVTFDPTGRWLVTADAMSDTLSVIAVNDLKVVRTVNLSGDLANRTAAQRGEALFRDGRLALDRWMSCSTCHTLGHTNGMNFDTQGDGSYGAPKNVPSLLGVAGTAPYTWTGRVAALEAQVHSSLRSTLNGPGLSETEIGDLVAYLRALEPPPPPDGEDDFSKRGAVVFHERRCATCHRPPLYTTTRVIGVGTDDATGGNTRFNPPALRGVVHSAPYLHDGRAGSLREVLDSHHPGDDRPWDRAEQEHLIAFLRTL